MKSNLDTYEISINIQDKKTEYIIDNISKNIPKILDKQNNTLKAQLFINQKQFNISSNENNEENTLYLQTVQYTLYSQSLVFDKNHNVIANIKESFSFVNKKYTVYDENKNVLYKIKGNFKGLKIYKNKKHIGDINLNTSNNSIKDLANNMNFNISFYEKCSNEEQLLLLGVLLHIDLTYIKKSLKRIIIKRTILYSFYVLMLTFILLLAYRAHYIFTLSDGLVLDNTISIDDKVEIVPIEEEPSLVFDKEFLYATKKIYSKPLYNNFNASKLFENNNTMKKEKEDFYKLLELYMKTDKLFTFKDDSLFYGAYNVFVLEPNSTLEYFKLRGFYASLISYIKYLDNQKKYNKSNKLLNKLVISLNNLIEKSYYFDYVSANVLYERIFKELKCNSITRQDIFKNNEVFLKRMFIKRLESENVHFYNFIILYYNEEALVGYSKERKNNILRISTALYKKRVDNAITKFEVKNKNIKKYFTKIYFYMFDIINITIFNDNNTYTSNFFANLSLYGSKSSFKYYFHFKEVINSQKKFKKCSKKVVLLKVKN